MHPTSVRAEQAGRTRTATQWPAASAVRSLRWLPVVLSLVPWLLGPYQVSTEQRVLAVVGPVHYSLLDWETRHLAERVGRLLVSVLRTPPTYANDLAVARAYLERPAHERLPRDPAAEAAIERLVSRAYASAGLPPGSLEPDSGVFPPVAFVVDPPPSVLVVAPRTELRVTQSVVLEAGLTVPEQEALERSVDSAGVSSLVAPIGGLATYPASVPRGLAPRDLLVTVSHEWVHHYLFFRPLGSAYWSSQEAREISETVADIVGVEIGEAVMQELGLQPEPPSRPPAARAARPSFDFRAFMRATRLEVERLLAESRVEEAEQYMERRRVELEPHGYRIRKINQAYFAFYGSYGEGFAASEQNPIPGLLRELRGQSPSLGAFLSQVGGLTTVGELRSAVEGG